MPLRDIPLRRKLMTLLLGICGTVVLLTCVSYLAYEVIAFRRTSITQLATMGEIIASNSTAALAFDNAEDAQQVLSALSADRHITAAVLYSADGQLFAHYPADLPAGSYPATAETAGHRFEPNGLAAFLPVTRNGKPLGTLYLRTDRTALYERLRVFGTFIFFVILAATALIFILARVLQNQISEPILRLAGTARSIAERQDYSTRATKHGNDEIGVLTDAFNHMIERVATLNRELEGRVHERTRALQEANRELEAFSYSVSHDLRAPLRHIGGFAMMLEKHATSMLDDKGRRYVTVIQQSTNRMGQLIDDLLAFSRHSRVELNRGPVPLTPLIEALRQAQQPETEGRNLTWTIAPLPVVLGDEALLRQVFFNLLANAVKYSRKTAAAHIEIGTQPAEPGEAIVFVRDNGAGFDMKYVDKLFGVFQRLHTDADFEGTGVGLATVRRIVQRHGGRVWAEGKPDAGATFYVALPTPLPS